MPAATVWVLVQVSVPSRQVHPVPPIDVAVRPAGKVSVTLTVPKVKPGPSLVTVIV